ncbi:MAG: hypothetical protein BIFFINMI_01720 [Phycisphaerae bacterium]|nr:hypothetical protein [Phycisphaerae bacterium]
MQRDVFHFDGTHRPLSRAARWLGWALPVAGLLLLMALGGCTPSVRQLRAQGRYYVKPSVAVLNFENAGSGGTGWDIGDGLADVLTDELVKTERFHVMERPQLGAVIRELQLQQGGATRQQGKKEFGRLKNVEFLIKGKVTDFGHVAGGGVWAKMDMLNVFGARNKAVLRIVYYVVDVESGEIVASRTVSESAPAGEASVQAAYKGVTFGGSMFYRTPLGKATAAATREAVAAICDAIARQPWQPRIALVDGERIVINGGTDRGLAAGGFFRALQPGTAIVDPDSGDVLDHLPGQQIGQIEVVEVHDRYSVARSVKRADYQIGQRLTAIVVDEP